VSDFSDALERYAGIPQVDLLPPDLRPKARSIERAFGWLPGPLRRFLLDKALQKLLKK
jgi:hypothetical protein